MDKGFGGSHKNPKRICERSPHACMHACIIHMQQQQQALGCVGCNLQASILSYILVTHCLAEVVQMSFQIPHSSALSHICCCHVAATSLSFSLSLSLSLTHTHTPTHPHTQRCASKQALWGGHYSLLVLAISYDEAQFNAVFVEGLLATVLCIALLVWLDDPASRLIFLQSSSSSSCCSSNALISSPTSSSSSSSSHRYGFFFAPLDFDTVCDHVWKLICHWWWGFGSRQLLMELIGIMHSSSKPSLPTGLKDEQLPHHPWHPNSHQQQAVVTNCCSWDIFFLLLLVLVLLLLLLLWNSVFQYQGIDLFTGS